jgi:hypothetical protein
MDGKKVGRMYKKLFLPVMPISIVQTTAADQFVASLMPVIDAIRAAGGTTLGAITQSLNQRGIRSARGGWYASCTRQHAVPPSQIAAGAAAA